MTRTKVNRLFWERLRLMLHHDYHNYHNSDGLQIVRREIARVRREAYRRGLEDGAEFMRQKLSGKYGNG